MESSDASGPYDPFGERWGTAWMAERTFRLEVGTLLNLSVNYAEESRLKRSRWLGGVAVGLPVWYEPQDRRGLINYVDAHLTGRHPITGVLHDHLVTSFSVEDNSTSTAEIVQAFARSFADERAFGGEVLETLRSAVTHLDTSAYEHLLPEDMREHP